MDDHSNFTQLYQLRMEDIPKMTLRLEHSLPYLFHGHVPMPDFPQSIPQCCPPTHLSSSASLPLRGYLDDGLLPGHTFFNLLARAHSIGVNRPAIMREIPHFCLFPDFCENVLHFWHFFETPKIDENRNKFSCTETFCSKKLYENVND